MEEMGILEADIGTGPRELGMSREEVEKKFLKK